MQHSGHRCTGTAVLGESSVGDHDGGVRVRLVPGRITLPCTQQCWESRARAGAKVRYACMPAVVSAWLLTSHQPLPTPSWTDDVLATHAADSKTSAASTCQHSGGPQLQVPTVSTCADRWKQLIFCNLQRVLQTVVGPVWGGGDWWCNQGRNGMDGVMAVGYNRVLAGGWLLAGC